MKPSLDEILFQWLAERGGRIPVPIPPRKEAILDLFETLVYHGYTKEEITSTSTKNAIVEKTTVEKTKDYKGWVKCTKIAIGLAIAEMWPIETKQFDPSKSSLKRVEYEQEDSSESSSVPVDEFGYRRLGEPLDRSVFKNEQDTPIEYDPEMRKLLGYDDE